MKGWWQGRGYVERVALAFVSTAVAMAVLGLATSAETRVLGAWIPSLVCNLLTTGLTIYFVNSVFVRREAAERDAKVRPALRVVMQSVQPIVHGALQELTATWQRLGPIVEDPEHWDEIARRVEGKMETYQALLDGEVVEALEIIRNSLQLIGAKGLHDDTKTHALQSYLLLQPIVVRCGRLRQRYFRTGEEVMYGGMEPLLEEFRKKHNLPADLASR